MNKKIVEDNKINPSQFTSENSAPNTVDKKPVEPAPVPISAPITQPKMPDIKKPNLSYTSASAKGYKKEKYLIFK